MSNLGATKYQLPLRPPQRPGRQPPVLRLFAGVAEQVGEGRLCRAGHREVRRPKTAQGQAPSHLSAGELHMRRSGVG